MSKQANLKKITALILAFALSAGVITGPGALDTGIVAYAVGESATVTADRLNVRSGPGTTYSKIATITAGTVVSITSEQKGNDGYTWYGISWTGGNGYARYDYITKNVTYAASDAAFEAYMQQQGFPESYKNGLRGLHQKYPNWVFIAQHTGLDWNTAVAEESKITKNLVASTSISSWKSTAQGAFDWGANYWPGFDGASWVQASSELISYYMDPRNFLTDPYVFQFEIQNYDSQRQNREGLLALVEGTFLDSEAIVPVEGSVIEGGTIIEGSTYTKGSLGQTSSPSTSSSTSSSSSSSQAGPGGSYGPGSGSSSGSSGYAIVGPGGSSGTSDRPNAIIGVGVDPSSINRNIQENPSGPYRVIGAIDDIMGTICSYAGSWQHSGERGSYTWYYVNDDGSLLQNGWFWLDGNNDGIAECYYFYSDGTMAADTLVDGYIVDADGKWTENGVIQTKPASEASVPSSSSSSQNTVQSAPFDTSASSGSSSPSGELKKVPYVDIIMRAAQSSGVSPYVIASTILQEQGKGTSDMISGNDSTYPGYYNFFNTDAYEHDGMSVLEAGLKYAVDNGWDTIEKSIIGGAENYGLNYVNKGQDTYYLKKFNVQGNNLYNHQYMTHVLAAASEGAKVSNAYSDAFKATNLQFKIPVYNNMPDQTTLPTKNGNPNNKLSYLNVSGFVITPTFNMDTTDYSLIVDNTVSEVTINATAIDSKATVSGAGTIGLYTGVNTVTLTVTAENGDQRNYNISINRRDGGNMPDQSLMTGGTGQSPSGWTGDSPSGPMAGPYGGTPSGPSSGTYTDTNVNGPGGNIVSPNSSSPQMGGNVPGSGVIISPEVAETAQSGSGLTGTAQTQAQTSQTMEVIEDGGLPMPDAGNGNSVVVGQPPQ